MSAASVQLAWQQTLSDKTLTCVAAAPDSADGHVLVAGDTRGELHVIGSDGAKRRVLRGHRGAIRSVAHLPGGGDGLRFLSGGADSTLRVWNLSGAEAPARSSGDGSAEAFVEDWSGIITSPQATSLRSQMLVRSQPGHAGAVTALAASEGSVASGGEDTLVKVWKDGAPIRTFDWHRAPVTGLFFRPGHPSELASISADWTIRTWDVEAGTMREKYQGHEDAILGMTWLGESSLLTGDISGVLYFWEYGVEEPVFKAKAGSAVRALAALGPGLACAGLDTGELVVLARPAPTRRRRRSANVEVRTVADGHDLPVRAMVELGESGLVTVGTDGSMCRWLVERQSA